jgi:hypothetical protein
MRAVINVVVFSVFHSLVIFYLPYLAYDGFLNNGIGDQLSYGTVAFSSLVYVRPSDGVRVPSVRPLVRLALVACAVSHRLTCSVLPSRLGNDTPAKSGWIA